MFSSLVRRRDRVRHGRFCPVTPPSVVNHKSGTGASGMMSSTFKSGCRAKRRQSGEYSRGLRSPQTEDRTALAYRLFLRSSFALPSLFLRSSLLPDRDSSVESRGGRDYRWRDRMRKGERLMDDFAIDVNALAARLAAAEGGDRAATADLFAALYGELHRLARRQLNANAAGISLSATTLLHETYLNINGRSAVFLDRARFFAYAARAMRGLIIDYVRDRRWRY